MNDRDLADTKRTASSLRLPTAELSMVRALRANGAPRVANI
jgi:hypothetical protein